MIERFANVVYWLASGIAAIAIFGGFYAWNYGVQPGNTFGGWVLTVFGVLVWLVGRAVRYVLAGR